MLFPADNGNLLRRYKFPFGGWHYQQTLKIPVKYGALSKVGSELLRSNKSAKISAPSKTTRRTRT